jgi:nucleotide-binding universal stress UspA family protein
MTVTILCLTRGGEASYPNQDGAIAIAKDLDEELLFLYISSVQFLDYSAAPKVVDIESELDEMGEFLLVMAQERARKAGVMADILVRRGNFSEVLKDVVQEYPIETVILGSSTGDTGVITEEYISEITEEISREYDVEFIILMDGNIQKTFEIDSDREEGQ